MSMTNPYPPGTKYVDGCDPTPPVPTKTAVANRISTDATTVDDKNPYQVGEQASRTAVVITNQGDGASPPAGSVVYVGPAPVKGNLKSRGVRIPVGAGRTFTTTAELWVLSETVGLPAGGNIIDVQNEFFG